MPDGRLARAREGYEGLVYQTPAACGFYGCERAAAHTGDCAPPLANAMLEAVRWLDKRILNDVYRQLGISASHMADRSNAMIQLPKYRCHKIVSAAKIRNVGHNINGTGSAVLLLDVPPNINNEVEVGSPWMAKHDPRIGGYYVVYEDGYASYSPAKAFQEGYAPLLAQFTDQFSFGAAILALKRGERVARAGWNGKGMWLRYQAGYTAQWPDTGFAEYLPFILMRTVTGAFVPWLASQTDVLAEDWQIIP